MRHNSIVSGHPKSTRIPRVDELLTRPSDLGRHSKMYIYNLNFTHKRFRRNLDIFCTFYFDNRMNPIRGELRVC